MDSEPNKPGIVPARPAASVMILRDGRKGIEVFMVKRSAAMAFSPNYLVFPGGAVDPEDKRQAQSPQYASSQWLPYQLAAIREAFEESGFLFAASAAQPHPVADAILPDTTRDRLLAGQLDFFEAMRIHRYRLLPEALIPVAHWITPEPLKKRFSTCFFISRQPPGQQGGHDGVEAVDSEWLNVATVVEGARSGELPVMLPTELNCLWLSQFHTVENAMQAARSRDRIPRVMPKIERREDGSWLILPAEAGYGITERRMP